MATRNTEQSKNKRKQNHGWYGYGLKENRFVLWVVGGGYQNQKLWNKNLWRKSWTQTFQCFSVISGDFCNPSSRWWWNRPDPKTKKLEFDKKTSKNKKTKTSKESPGPRHSLESSGFSVSPDFFRFPEVFWFLCNPSSRWKHHQDPKEKIWNQKNKDNKKLKPGHKHFENFWFFWCSSGVPVFFAVLVLVADGGFRIQKQKTAVRQKNKKTKPLKKVLAQDIPDFFFERSCGFSSGVFCFFAILVVDEGFQIQKAKKNCYKTSHVKNALGADIESLVFWSFELFFGFSWHVFCLFPVLVADQSFRIQVQNQKRKRENNQNTKNKTQSLWRTFWCCGVWFRLQITKNPSKKTCKAGGCTTLLSEVPPKKHYLVILNNQFICPKSPEIF